MLIECRRPEMFLLELALVLYHVSKVGVMYYYEACIFQIG
jgi:hypothetical protein